MFIDSHAHLMFSQFDGELEAIITRAKSAGVLKIINVGCDLRSCDQAVVMLSEYDCLYATLGLHPYDAADLTEELLVSWEKLIDENHRIVAIGECGLDYFKAKVSRDVQKRAFRMQLEFAMRVGLPLVVHNRNADDDCLEILDELNVGAGRIDVVFHCYGSDLDFAEKLWGRGYYTSFTGIATYPSAVNLHDVLRAVPLDKFMVETDCPYLAPQKYRGKRNEPAYVVEVAEKIAELKELSLSEIEERSTENALNLFKGLVF